MGTLYEVIFKYSYALQDESNLQKTQSAVSLVNQVTEQVLNSREVVRKAISVNVSGLTRSTKIRDIPYIPLKTLKRFNLDT